MSNKASVTKELNAKHTKILEALLKVPDNKLCADCQRRAPRWASINLGIFICLQCSGVHRSLGVHISKVRSTTLDTWLPDQIACMQSAGNEKSNSYWEAELPPNFDRQEIEKFIRAKYEEKRWIPKSERETTPTISDINPNFANFEEVESMVKNETGTVLKISETVSTSEMPVESGSKTRNIKKTRKLSVEEENHKIVKPGKAGCDTSTKENNGKAPTDLFSLLYINNAKQERYKDPAPKARWGSLHFGNATRMDCCGNGQRGVIGPVHEIKYTECTKGWCKDRFYHLFTSILKLLILIFNHIRNSFTHSFLFLP